jgi:hypothetical protein
MRFRFGDAFLFCLTSYLYENNRNQNKIAQNLEGVHIHF